jgi:hypothetical protein
MLIINYLRLRLCLNIKIDTERCDSILDLKKTTQKHCAFGSFLTVLFGFSGLKIRQISF